MRLINDDFAIQFQSVRNTVCD